MAQAEIGNLRVRLGLDTAEFAAGAAKAMAQVDGMRRSFSTFGTALAGAISFGALTAGVNAAVDAMKRVAEIGDVAESIGVTAEELQSFERMAIASGTSTDVLTRGLQSIAEQSVDTKSKLAKLFEANGLSLEGKKVNEVIREFMTLLRGAQTPAQQLAMITGVLGDKVGRQLVEAFRDGAEGADAAFRDMVKSGEYHTNAEVKRIQDLETSYNEVMGRIATNWQRMVVGLVTAADAVSATLSAKSQGGQMIGRFAYPTGGVAPGASKFADARNSGMGSAGGPNEFASPPPPIKLSVLPPDQAQLDDAKKKIVDAVTPPPIDVSAWDLGAQFEALYGNELVNLQEKLTQLKAVYDAGAVSTETYRAAVEGLKNEFSEVAPHVSELQETFQGFSVSLEQGLQAGLAELVAGTHDVNEAFAAMALEVARQLEDMAKRMLINAAIQAFVQIISGGFGGGLAGGGAAVNIGGALFGGLFAEGGTLGAGQWGIAGEAGPEIIHGPATITPMDKLGGGGPPVININNYAGADVRTRERSDGTLEIDIIEKELAARAARGGTPISAGIAQGFGLRRQGR